MKTRPVPILLALLALLAFSGCGPILGLLSKTTEGTSIGDAGGDPSAIKPGSRLLILSPFPKTEDAFYIVKGEDEQTFADEFNRIGLFHAETVAGKIACTTEAAILLSSKSPSTIKSEFGLAAEPDLVLTGTLLSRKTYVAPLRGVVISVSWRLVFTDLQTGKSWTIDAESKELAEHTIPRIVERIGKRLGR